MIAFLTVCALLAALWYLDGGYRQYKLRRLWATPTLEALKWRAPLFSPEWNEVLWAAMMPSLNQMLYSRNLLDRRHELERLPGFDPAEELRDE